MSDPSSVSKPSWDSSQLTERAWLYDLFPWIPTSNALYATLLEHGYSLTPQGRVVVYSTDHAKAVFHRFYQVCTFNAPSPVAPTFVFPTTQAPQAAPATATSDRSLRSGTPAAASTTAPAVAPVLSQVFRDLTAAELDHYTSSPLILPDS
eukprot:3125971-Pleurochrysis_carterae.AAC.1